MDFEDRGSVAGCISNYALGWLTFFLIRSFVYQFYCTAFELSPRCNDVWKVAARTNSKIGLNQLRLARTFFIA